MMSRSTLAVLLVAAFACREDADPNAPPGPTDQSVRVGGRSWSVPPGSEIYLCRRTRTTNFWAITGFRTTIPTGQHRLIISASPEQQSTGDFNCTSAAPSA